MSFLQFAGGLARGASKEIDERDQRSQLIADRAVQRYLNKYDVWEANYNKDMRAYKEAYNKLDNEAGFLNEQQMEMVLANGPDGVEKFLKAMKSDYEEQYMKYKAAPDATGHKGMKDVPKPEFEYTDEMKNSFLGATFKRSDEYLDAKLKGNLDDQMFLAKDLDTQAKLYAQGLNQLTPIDRSIDVMTKTMEEQAGGIGVPVQYVQSQIRTQLANLGVTNPEIIEGTLGGGTGYNAPLYEIMSSAETRNLNNELTDTAIKELNLDIAKEEFSHIKLMNPRLQKELKLRIENAESEKARSDIRDEMLQIELEYKRITMAKNHAEVIRDLDVDIKQANLNYTNQQITQGQAEFDADSVNRMYTTAMGAVTSLTQEVTRLATQEPTENNKKLLAEARTKLSNAHNTLENITMTKMHMENMTKGGFEQDKKLNEYMVYGLEQKLIENHHYTGSETTTVGDSLEQTTTENPYFAVKDIDGTIRNVYKENKDTSQEYFEIYDRIEQEVSYDFIQKWGNVSEDGKTVTIKEEHKFNKAMERRLQTSLSILVGDGTDVNLNEWRDTFLADKIGDLAPIVRDMIFYGEQKSEIVEELNVYTKNHKDSNMVYDILSSQTEREREKGQFGPTKIVTTEVDEDTEAPIVGYETASDKKKREWSEEIKKDFEANKENAETALREKGDIKTYLNHVLEDMRVNKITQLSKNELSKKIQRLSDMKLTASEVNAAMDSWMEENKGKRFEFFDPISGHLTKSTFSFGTVRWNRDEINLRPYSVTSLTDNQKLELKAK